MVWVSVLLQVFRTKATGYYQLSQRLCLSEEPATDSKTAAQGVSYFAWGLHTTVLRYDGQQDDTEHDRPS